MAKSINQPSCIYGFGTFQSEYVAQGRARVRPSQTFIQQINHVESNFIDLNVGTVRCWSGEIVEMLEHRSVDICCVQETRFRRKSN